MDICITPGTVVLKRQWEARQIEGVNPPCVGEILEPSACRGALGGMMELHII